MDFFTLSFLIILIIIVIVVIVYVLQLYNRLKVLKNAAEATLGQVRVALKKRLDTIDQLLGSVKSYAAFERDTFERVTKMRTDVLRADTQGLTEIDRESRRLFSGIVAVAENYPVLRTSEPVGRLMEAVKGIEDEVARHRYTYNNIVQEFNTRLDTIPSKYIAASQGFRKMDYLQFEEDVTKRPEIKF